MAGAIQTLNDHTFFRKNHQGCGKRRPKAGDDQSSDNQIAFQQWATPSASPSTPYDSAIEDAQRFFWSLLDIKLATQYSSVRRIVNQLVNDKGLKMNSSKGLTISEVAALLGVSKVTVHNWKHQGRLPDPISRTASPTRWTKDSIEQWKRDVDWLENQSEGLTKFIDSLEYDPLVRDFASRVQSVLRDWGIPVATRAAFLDETLAVINWEAASPIGCRADNPAMLDDSDVGVADRIQTALATSSLSLWAGMYTALKCGDFEEASQRRIQLQNINSDWRRALKPFAKEPIGVWKERGPWKLPKLPN